MFLLFLEQKNLIAFVNLIASKKVNKSLRKFEQLTIVCLNLLFCIGFFDFLCAPIDHHFFKFSKVGMVFLFQFLPNAAVFC